MPIPVVYRKTAPTISTYNWAELSTGVGYINFYCADGIDETSGATHILTTSNAIPSFPRGHEETASGTVMDEEFTTTFNKPTVLKGDMYVKIPFYKTDSGAGDKMQFIITVKKNDETLQTLNYTDADPQYPNEATNFMGVLDIPKTILTQGDTLKVNIKVVWTEGGTSGWIVVKHDPSNEAYLYGGVTVSGANQMIVSLPTKIIK